MTLSIEKFLSLWGPGNEKVSCFLDTPAVAGQMRGMRVAAPLVLRDGDREKLTAMAVPGSGSAGAVRRALIVLLAGDGLAHTEIAQRCGTSVPTVRLWRARYTEGGIGALRDLPRPGRPHTVDEAAIVARTLQPPPQRLGVTCWSSRLLAHDLGISSATVVAAWRKWHLQPRRPQELELTRMKFISPQRGLPVMGDDR